MIEVLKEFYNFRTLIPLLLYIIITISLIIYGIRNKWGKKGED